MLDILLMISNIENTDEREIVQKLFFTYARRIKALARYILKNDTDAEDALHNVFLNIIKYRQKFVQIDRDETERLIVIYTRSVCFNMRKHKYKIAFVSTGNARIDEDGDATDMEFADDTDILGELVEKENCGIWSRAIDALGSPAREIVLLRYYENYSNTEIAELLGLNASTVGTILQRSLQKLKKSMEGYVYGQDG